MSDSEQTSAEADQRFHNYTTNDIPWYVRLIWLLFWAFIVYYTVKYFFPVIQTEMVSPP